MVSEMLNFDYAFREKLLTESGRWCARDIEYLYAFHWRSRLVR